MTFTTYRLSIGGGKNQTTSFSVCYLVQISFCSKGTEVFLFCYFCLPFPGGGDREWECGMREEGGERGKGNEEREKGTGDRAECRGKGKRRERDG